MEESKIGTLKSDGREYATITIDGKEYTLAYDFKKICDAEDLTGVNLLEALESLTRLRASQLLGLLYAALEAGPEPTWPGKKPLEVLLEVANLVRLDTINPLTEALAKAYDLSLPDVPEEDDTTTLKAA